MRACTRARRAVGLGLVLAALIPATADGQRTRMTLTGLPLTVTTTSANDFDAGSVSLGTVSFSVDATNNNPVFSPRATTVQVQCVVACPNSGTLGVTSLQWRRDDLGTWNTLTTAYATIETRNVTFNGANDPWSNSVHWRYLLTWTGNPPTAATLWRVRFRLVVAGP